MYYIFIGVFHIWDRGQNGNKKNFQGLNLEGLRNQKCFYLYKIIHLKLVLRLQLDMKALG